MLPLALAACAAVDPPERGGFQSLDVAQLKSLYLECGRRAEAAMLDSGDAAHCSVVHEQLKQHAFDGDFERLLAWWMEQRLAETKAAAR